MSKEDRSPSSETPGVNDLIASIDAARNLREDVTDFVRDFTSVGTFELEGESDSRLEAFCLAMKYVPVSNVDKLVQDIEEYIDSEVGESALTQMNSELREALKELKEKAEHVSASGIAS